ncbi:MAG: DUF1631 domain-containing protein [Gammaproteobacteria bacterium]|nr:DUF1631 domain-containing protein [Gammaproteobacteria bacterium]
MSDSENENQTEQGLDEQPKYYTELVDEIISQLEEFFETHLEDVFKKADDYLFDAANSASSTAEQNGLFECMNAIRADKKFMQQGFVDELSSYLQPMSELDELPAKKKSKKTVALGLVEQNEMDEMVTLTTISSKAAMDHSESISNLITRFKELGKYNNDIFHGEALEPKRLCDAMHEAVSQTDLIDGNRLVVYRFFNEALIKDIGKLYDTLNNLLIDQGILPEIDFSGMAPHYEETAHQEDVVEDEAPPQDAPPPQGRRAFGSGMQGYAGHRQQAPPMNAGAPGVPGSPPPMPPQAYQQPSSGGYAPAAPRRAFGSGMRGYAQGAGQNNSQAVSSSAAASTGPAGQEFSAGVPVGQVRQSIENYMGGSQSDAAPAGGSGYYSQQQVMTALTELQAPAEDLSQTPLVFDANQIKKAVLSSIGETEGGAVTKAVHHVSEKTIDFIKLIFDAIIDEESITDEIKTLLLSLQIPVIKAAMLDADFFVDDRHPARQLLDKIAEAGVGVSEHHDPVYIDIEKIVRKLLTDYNDDVVAFKVALDELKELTEEIYRKARETEAASQKTIKMAHAKSIVLQEIRKITIGKELPEGVRTLVLKIWPSMMFNHFLKNGKANDEWVELLMILQKIIESVQPINSKAELEELGLTNHDIVEATRSKLANCKKGKKVADAVLHDLEATYEALMSASEVTEELDDEPQVDAQLLEQTAETESPEDALAEKRSGAEADSEEELELEQEEALAEAEPEPEVDPEITAKEKIARLPEGVAPGAWFIVYNGEDKPVRRLKLAVILVHDASMVFVDHLGNVVIEKEADVFADEIERGLSGIIMQHSVFDHALHSALESIEH